MSDKHVVRVTFRMSDYHLSEGATLPDGSPNPLEDFKDIEGYERELEAVQRRWPTPQYPDIILELRWGGDMIDFHPIRWRGSFRIVPTEEAALSELETNLRGHERFYEATARFLSDPRARLVVEIGNHDLPLVWPSLQARLAERLLPEGERHRIAFAYGPQVDGKVLYLHGAEFDPFNANPKRKDLFITGKADRGPLAASFLTMLVGAAVARGLWTGARDFTFWRAGLIIAGIVASFILLGALFRKISFWRSGPEVKILNTPYGADLDAWLVSTLKPWFPWYGRQVAHGHTLAQSFSVLRTWRYVGLTATFGFFHLVYHRFFRDLLAARRKARLIASLRMLTAMTKAPDINRAIWRLLRRHPQVKWVVIGHYHMPTAWTIQRRDRRVVMVDNGTGIEQMRMDVAPGSFLERVVHYIRKHPRAAFARTIVSLIIAVIPFGIEAITGWRGHVFEAVWTSAIAGLLLVRMSLALEEKERFTRFTPVEAVTYDDGTQDVRLLRFDQHAPEGTDPFSRYLET